MLLSLAPLIFSTTVSVDAVVNIQYEANGNVSISTAHESSAPILIGSTALSIISCSPYTDLSIWIVSNQLCFMHNDNTCSLYIALPSDGSGNLSAGTVASGSVSANAIASQNLHTSVSAYIALSLQGASNLGIARNNYVIKNIDSDSIVNAISNVAAIVSETIYTESLAQKSIQTQTVSQKQIMAWAMSQAILNNTVMTNNLIEIDAACTELLTRAAVFHTSTSVTSLSEIYTVLFEKTASYSQNEIEKYISTIRTAGTMAMIGDEDMAFAMSMIPFPVATQMDAHGYIV